MKIEAFKNKKDEWCWRLLSKNGKIVADSAESYTSLANVKRAITRLINELDKVFKAEKPTINVEILQPQQKASTKKKPGPKLK